MSPTMNARRLILAIALLAASPVYAQQTIGQCPVLPANNIWNTPVDTLPMLSNSASMVNTIGASTGFHADFGSGTWNGGPIGIPFIPVPGSQTKYPATFLYDDESDVGPYAVPLNAPIEGGSSSNGDRHAIAIDVDNCILYELYRAFPQTSSWTADSGAIFDLNSNALRPAIWTSADAAGLPIMPGLVTHEEILTGEIKHAIRFTVPQTRREFVWPARHYASSLTGTQYPRMGERFRLKASFDVSPFPAEVQVILAAMKKYGIMLADNGSAWYISGKPDSRWNNDNLRTLNQLRGSDFEAVDALVLRIDPDSGEARQAGLTIVSIDPSPVPLGNFDLSIDGDGFTAGSIVSFDGAPLPTTVVSATRVAATGHAPATKPSVAVTVATTGGGVSNTVYVAVVAMPPVLVTVSPASATVRSNRTVQFTADAPNTPDQSVIWKVNNIAGGNSIVGTISASGLYCAPSAVRKPLVVTVSATSTVDPAKSSSAQVMVSSR